MSYINIYMCNLENGIDDLFAKTERETQMQENKHGYLRREEKDGNNWERLGLAQTYKYIHPHISHIHGCCYTRY